MPSIFKRGKKYVIEYTDENGKRRQRVAFPQKDQSWRMALNLEGRAEKIRKGIVDADTLDLADARKLKVADALDLHLATVRGNAKRQAYIRLAVDIAARACGWTTVGDMGTKAAARALSKHLNEVEKQYSTRTRNARHQAVNGFARWLVRHNHLNKNPFRSVDTADEQQTPKRRALADGEILQLLEAVEQVGDVVPTTKRVKGKEQAANIRVPHRGMLYRLALGTGYRLGELKSLTPESFRIDEATPVVVCEAASTKNSKRCEQPIRRDLAMTLQPWLETLQPCVTIWGSVPDRMADVMRTDLAEAGIEFEDRDGRRADFHALRHTYITRLAMAGTAPAKLKELARHASIETTMRFYTHAEQADLANALEALPEYEPAPDSITFERVNGRSFITTDGERKEVLPPFSNRAMQITEADHEKAAAYSQHLGGSTGQHGAINATLVGTTTACGNDGQ